MSLSNFHPRKLISFFIFFSQLNSIIEVLFTLETITKFDHSWANGIGHISMGQKCSVIWNTWGNTLGITTKWKIPSPPLPSQNPNAKKNWVFLCAHWTFSLIGWKLVCHHFQLGLKPISNNVKNVFIAMLVFSLACNININNIKGLWNTFMPWGEKKCKWPLALLK